MTHDRNSTTPITLSIPKRITMHTTTSLTTQRRMTRAQAPDTVHNRRITGKMKI
jgi:hypothetical protein